ncbi:MAG TPA: methyl-accepting chemotaxis protein [Burkholderiaceae bacterium]|nr:methyl-accepting chemotaxis protein [Burkholderiaceae bacterium]
MRFKFPGHLLPLAGGAKRLDPDTAIADELAPDSVIRPPDPVPVRGGPAAAAAALHGGSPRPHPAQRRAAPSAMPLLTRFPLRRQVAVLFPLLVASLAMGFFFLWLDTRQTAIVASQTQLVGDSLMHSQRLAKAAPNALLGNPEAFRQLRESRDYMAAAIAVLQAGGALAEHRLGPLEVELQPLAQRLAEVWARTDLAASTLLQQQRMLATFATLVRAVGDAAPRLAELSDQVVAGKLQANAPATEVAAAGQLTMLTQRIAKNVGLLGGGDAINAETALVLGRDTNAFREISEGLLNGSEPRRLSAVREGELRQRLVELRGLFGDLQRPIATILIEMPKLQAAKAAEQRIFAESEVLREAFGEIQAGLAAAQVGRKLNQSIFVALVGIAVLAAVGLALVYYHDMNRRAAEAEAQRAEAERLEQEAKRTNEQNQSAILRLMNELQEVADGDLTVQATVSEDITGAIADSVNYTVEELRNLVSRINTTAELVTDASSKAQLVSSSLLRASEQQSREIRETGEAVLRMAEQINDVSTSAAESARVAHRSLSAADDGRKAVHNAIAGMNGIRDQIQETAKRIKRLGESSQEIGEIVELISDITEQTNVLALNAAIQAASAGEAGRGFTVVAEEVQRLAERSAEATRQIAALIKTIQTDTQDAIAAMERSTQGVVEGTRLSDGAGRALGDIGRVSTQLAELIQSISRTTAQQAASASTVAQSIQRILLVTEQTSEGTQQTAGSIAQLTELTRELKNSVARFKVA